jgi:hypothetical protein
MTLLIDRASTARRLSGEELRRWAQEHSAFISSEMGQMGPERAELAEALRDLGMSVVVFEDLGGRDEDAVSSYLDGVARSDIYIGVVADRYGQMQSSGRSPTHEEYLYAEQNGKRISFWVSEDDAGRQGNTRDFVQEVQTFHTTGRFRDPQDLARRVVERMAEMAADDEAPWVKVGEAIFRAEVIRDLGDRFEIEAEIRDSSVVYYLEGLRPDQWNSNSETVITTPRRSGAATVEKVTSESRSASRTEIALIGRVAWADGSGDPMAAGTAGLSPEDLTELGLRVGLFGETVPERLGMMEFMVDSSDPLAELVEVQIPEAGVQAIARLLLVERLVGTKRVARIERFALGPLSRSQRRFSLTYTEGRRYSNVEPGMRTIEGIWRP